MLCCTNFFYAKVDWNSRQNIILFKSIFFICEKQRLSINIMHVMLYRIISFNEYIAVENWIDLEVVFALNIWTNQNSLCYFYRNYHRNWWSHLKMWGSWHQIISRDIWKNCVPLIHLVCHSSVLNNSIAKFELLLSKSSVTYGDDMLLFVCI